MKNFNKENLKFLWDEIYNKATTPLLWEENNWVSKCNSWLVNTLNSQLKSVDGDCNLLDYACGNGVYFDSYMNSLKIKVNVFGADISSVAIDNAKHKYANKYGNRILLKDNIFLPEEIGRCDFDVAICWSTLHHIDRSILGRCIKDLYDCLKKDGILIVSGWGQSAKRYKPEGGISPVTKMPCWPIGSIVNLLKFYFDIESHEFIHHEGESKDAFEVFVCRKKDLTLLQRYENELIFFLHDLGEDILFFHLYKYRISQDLMSGEMDRHNSFAFYRNREEMAQIFARFVKQLRYGCGNKAFFFTKDIYSMRQKKHLFAFFDKDASSKNLNIEDTGFSTFYDFKLHDSSKAEDKRIIYKPINCITIDELYNDISNIFIDEKNFCLKVEKNKFPDDFAERFYYGLNQGRNIGIYFFVCCSDEERNTSIGDGGLVVYTNKRLSDNVVKMIDHLISKWTSTLTTQSFKTIFKKKSTQSAIASIMSRNGSHNIGSHVLAALSHNVGTMPDDRMLYQYIQLRMDYIANVTSEISSWTQPTMFLGEMMRTFLSQHHLLNHIAESEGLSAWEFQNINLNSESFQSQERKLKFHIRKIVHSSTNPKYIEIVKYDDPDQKIDFSNDVALAIPAGAAGQHAFFTIIENIVRNSAKHDWSNPPKSTKHLKKVGPEKEVGKTTGSEDKVRREIPHGNLEIYIDFEDKAKEGNVEFTIWTNMSDVLDRVVDGNLNSKEALHNQLKDKLKLAFIDESGTLRRENWGLAEMRISAGFLQGRNISEIGGLKQPKKPIIEPVAQLEKIQSENGKTSDVNHLGYRFSVPKPQTILVLVDDITEDKEKLKAINIVFSEWEKQADKFKGYGICAKKYSDVKSKDKLGYEFVVMDDLREENKGWFLPFRVITINPTELEGARELVPLLSKWDSCQALLKQVLECIKDDGTIDKLKLNDNVLNKIFACWCKHIKQRHMNKENAPVNLVLTVKEDNPSGAGQGLISKRDVVKFVFEEAFNSSARSFVELYKLENTEEKVCDKCQKTACDCTKEERETFYAIKELMKPNAKKIIILDEIHGGSYKSLICSQLFNWYKKLGREDSILIYLKEMNDLKDGSTSAEIEKCQKEIKQYKDKPGTEEQINLLRSRIRSLHGKKDLKHYFGAFIDYLVQVCDQMETVLCKYAENIVSLPKGYGNSDNSIDNPFCEKWEEPEMWIWKGPRKVGGEKTDFTESERELGLYDKSNAIKNNLSIEFVRHSDPNKEPTREERLYLEPLSGSQSSLTLLEQINFDSKQLITKLVETAFLRILVIDERVAKFLREHKDEVAKTFNCMHIYVADDKKVDDELSKLQACENDNEIADLVKKLEGESKNKPIPDYNDDCLLLPLSSYNIWKGREALDVKDDPNHKDRMKNLIDKFKNEQGKAIFDILIIHQGIIDKWFPGTSNNSQKVDLLLSYLRELFPYVVITTGRGTPANIPEMARMLPFSTIETTLFRKYPEKMLLVDAVMNLLPKGSDNQ